MRIFMSIDLSEHDVHEILRFIDQSKEVCMYAYTRIDGKSARYIIIYSFLSDQKVQAIILDNSPSMMLDHLRSCQHSAQSLAN